MLKAFHGDKAVKKKYLDRIIGHQTADRLVKRQGWDGEKGCAVGCTLEAYDHSRYTIELGIPEWFARVEDSLFEGISREKSRNWPEKFLRAIPVGANLEPVKSKFLVVVLKHSLVSMDAVQYDESKWLNVKSVIGQTKAAVKQMIKAQKSGNNILIKAARTAAISAANLARTAAISAADSSARSAAYLAYAVAYSAAYSTMYPAASAATCDHYANELLKLLKKAR